MRSFGWIVVISMLALEVGCSKGKDGGSGSSASSSLGLPKLGLTADAPAGSEVGDSIGGDGLMITGPGVVVTIEAASDSRPKTAEADKEEASMYSPTNDKIEVLADGWIHTFQNKGDMGENFFVHVRREIDGKAIWCETTCSSPEQQANALAICKSLKKG
jgi:hypothetical protein